MRNQGARIDALEAELGSLAFSILHDFRAPVRHVRELSKLLVEAAGAKLTPDEREILERIDGSVARVDDMLRAFEDYGNVARTDVILGAVSLVDAATTAKAMTEEEVSGRARFEIAERMPDVHAQRALLIGALVQIFKNAIEFGRPGVEPVIRISAKTSGDTVRIEIADNGVGIAPKDTKQIFDLFWRVERNRERDKKGVGLPLARRAIHRIGGTIGVDSKLGEGSTFWIELPVSA